MKKILLIAALTLSTGLAMAQTMSKDGVMMKENKMMMMKDGKTMPMDSDVTLSDGTKVMKDGTVMKKDGTKMMMKNGDAMDMSGMMKK
jgi:hypothetical protein